MASLEEDIKKTIEFYKGIAHNIKYMFDEAMQGNFEEFDEIQEDLWKCIIHLAALPLHIQKITGLGEQQLKERLTSFEEKYKLLFEEGVCDALYYLEDCEEKKAKEGLDADEKIYYEEAKQVIENIKKEYGNIDFDCYWSFSHFVNQLICYFENAAIPIGIVNEYTADALKFREIANNNYEVTPEQKAQFEEDRAKKIDNLFRYVSNEKIKAGLHYLINKQVLTFNNTTGKIELSKEYMNKGRGGATMLAFICAFLFQYEGSNFSYKGKFKHDRQICKVIGYKILFTTDAMISITNLFGLRLRNDISRAIKPNQYDDSKNCLLAPPKSEEVYEILREFEKEYK